MCSTNRSCVAHFRFKQVLELSARDFCYKFNLIVSKKGGTDGMAGSNTENIVETYNYESFSRSESAGKSTEFKSSLRAGEEAPDFELPTLEGERVRLSDFRGKKHVLLEFGSIT
jgi:AhpC/TSA family